MTLSSINSAAFAQAAEPVKPVSTPGRPASRPKQSPGGADTDSVHLSNAAQAQLSAVQSAVQEATETSVQTEKEAMNGDLQAQRLLAREAQATQATHHSPRTLREG